MTNAESLLDPMPDLELMGNTLDLGRPELAALMRRYAASPPRPQTTLLRQPAAVIVTHHHGPEIPVRKALENEGWFVKTCGGPGKGDCPVMSGKRCPLRESADVALVYIDPNGGSGMIPRLRCAADSASPGVVALEGRLDPPRYGHGTASVGAFRDPRSVLTVISALLSAHSQREKPPA